MMAKTDFDRLKALADSHGAQPRRWPVMDADVLLARTAGDARAQAHLDEARALDTLLSCAPEPEITQDRVDAVVGLALRDIRLLEAGATAPKAAPKAKVSASRPVVGWRRRLTGWATGSSLGEALRMGWLAGATLAGLALGVVTLPAQQQPVGTATAYTTAAPRGSETLDAASLLFTSYTVDTATVERAGGAITGSAGR